MSRCRRVLVNMPKCSSKAGINAGIWNATRVRLCKLVIDRRYGRYFWMSLG